MIDWSPRSPMLSRRHLQLATQLIEHELTHSTFERIPLHPGSGRGRLGYDPNQPRVPAGHPDGGQWTSVGARPRGFVSEPFARLALALADGHAKSSIGSVHDYVAGELSFPLISVRYSDQIEIPGDRNLKPAEGHPQPTAKHGRRYAEAGGLSPVDEIAVERTTEKLQEILLSVNSRISRRRDPISARLYGIAVHKAFADAVKARNLPGIGIDGVEQSFDLDGLIRYGADGSIRTDVVLRNKEGVIIAIYDVKTGNATMRPSREAKILKYTKAGSFVRVIILHAKRGGR